MHQESVRTNRQARTRGDNVDHDDDDDDDDGDHGDGVDGDDGNGDVDDEWSPDPSLRLSPGMYTDHRSSQRQQPIKNLKKKSLFFQKGTLRIVANDEKDDDDNDADCAYEDDDGDND